MNEHKKVNSSILFKLRTWHLSQVFFGFIWINIVIVALFSGALFYHAETVISQTAEAMQGELILESPPKGFQLPKILHGLAPDNTKNAIRRIITDEWETSLLKKAEKSTYRVFVPRDGGFVEINYNWGVAVGLFIRMFIILLVLELLSFIDSAVKGSKAMKRALSPIAELTQTAKSINKTPAILTDAQLLDLKGKIDTITATDLDAGISVSTSQNELKELASAINGMLSRINQSYRSQVRFVSDASHELRTPIAVIQGYANLLDRWGKNDEKALQESIEAIKSEASNMKDLVEQLLFLARGDNESMQLNMEKINLSELVTEILRETAMIDPSHTISSNITENVYITGDIQLIKQAIRIFIDNSIKYTPVGEEIAVSAAQDGAFAKITVQDNGIGISAEDLPYVFDRFFRSDDSRTRKTGGTGLGLSIAKWIISRHGGNVEILSRKEIGTRITISLIRGENL